MEKSFIMRMSADDQDKIEAFTNAWGRKGAKMTKAELYRNALNEYLSEYDPEDTQKHGNLVGVRLDPNKYNFDDLFNMASDFQNLANSEIDPSRKYIYGQLFQLLSSAVSLEFNVASFKKNFKVETPEAFTEGYYKMTKQLVAGFDEAK